MHNLIKARYPAHVLAILEAFFGGNSAMMPFEKAVERLRIIDANVNDPAHAVAAVIRDYVQPNRMFSEQGGYLEKELTFGVLNKLLLVPTPVCSVHWPNADPRLADKIDFRLTFLHGFNVEVLTAGSGDSWRGSEVLIGVSPKRDDRRAVALELLEQGWRKFVDISGTIWDQWLGDGLVDPVAGHDLAMQLMDGSDLQPPSVNIGDAALTVFTRNELKQLDQTQLFTLARMLRDRLARVGPLPTLNELVRIRKVLTKELFAIQFDPPFLNGADFLDHPIIPMSPSELPSQRIVAVANLPERPDHFDAVVGWGTKPEGVELPHGPSNADYLGLVEWAWGVMNTRMDAYYLSKGRTHWILWSQWYDDNWGKWEWLAIGHVPRKQASRRQAAVHLMADFWRMEKEANDLDHFHWLNQEGFFDASEWRTIGFMVWPTQQAIGYPEGVK